MDGVGRQKAPFSILDEKEQEGVSGGGLELIIVNRLQRHWQQPLVWGLGESLVSPS